MALHIYRYRRDAPVSNSMLRLESDLTALAMAQLATFSDIQIDDSRVADLDAFMADMGYLNVATDPVPTVQSAFIATVPQVQTYQAIWLKDAADPTAASATAMRGFNRNGMPAGVVWTFVGGRYIPAATVAASPVNFATITLTVRTAAGAPVGTLATVTTSAGWTVNVPQALVPGAILVVNPGEYVTVAISKTGTGAIVPPGSLDAEFTVA
jgi:hypothetical protein